MAATTLMQLRKRLSLSAFISLGVLAPTVALLLHSEVFGAFLANCNDSAESESCHALATGTDAPARI